MFFLGTKELLSSHLYADVFILILFRLIRATSSAFQEALLLSCLFCWLLFSAFTGQADLGRGHRVAVSGEGHVACAQWHFDDDDADCQI